MAITDSAFTQTIYGTPPTYLVSQRANSVQASSLISLSSSIFNSTYETTRASWMKEVTDTLVGLGYWKGSV